MSKILSGICAVALSVSLGATLPAISAPLPAPQSLTVYGANHGLELHEVHYRHRWDRRSPRFERRGGHTYYRGYRGYRDHRRGYRQFGGYWFPPAAFIAGAIIGGAIASPPPRAPSGTYHYGPRHVEWCYNRFRSYRSWDNTYQPYSGPRRQCISPYS